MKALAAKPRSKVNFSLSLYFFFSLSSFLEIVRPSFVLFHPRYRSELNTEAEHILLESIIYKRSNFFRSIYYPLSIKGKIATRKIGMNLPSSLLF